MKLFSILLPLATSAFATPLLFDGRVPLNYTSASIDASNGPYLTVVKGTQNASHYTSPLGLSIAPTPLWITKAEQAFAVKIDNSSVFIPGGNLANAQYGFRRTDLIAQSNGNHTALEIGLAKGTNVYHFSIKEDKTKKLNFAHEYQIVFIEPSDGSHVFGVQLGSPFTNPTGKLPAKDAQYFKVLDHSLNVLFKTPFKSDVWHNFGVQVDWDARTLAVLYSSGFQPLKVVTKALPNTGVSAGTRGEFHIGVLKLPLVNSTDTPANQGDVVHHGIQEGTTEGLLYSGVFVESVKEGISIGYHQTIKRIS